MPSVVGDICVFQAVSLGKRGKKVKEDYIDEGMLCKCLGLWRFICSPICAPW